jgi:hypothetical protein
MQEEQDFFPPISVSVYARKHQTKRVRIPLIRLRWKMTRLLLRSAILIVMLIRLGVEIGLLNSKLRDKLMRLPQMIRTWSYRVQPQGRKDRARYPGSRGVVGPAHWR